MTKILLQHNIAREKIYFFSVLTVLCALFAAYVYFVSASIVQVVIRKETGKEIALLHSEISGLETDYIKKQHSMSTEIAEMQGFVATANKVFIDRSAGTLVLSTNGI